MTIPRIVIDSNVIISSVFFGGKPRRILEYVIEGKVECFISLDILDELRDVVKRPKFGLSSAYAMALVQELHTICQLVTPTISVQEITADPDDNKILECALIASADKIITGDTHLLNLKEWNGISILTPSKFIANMRDY